MNNTKIKGVVFDFGGVMTATVMPELARRLIVDELGIDWRIVVDGFAKYRRLMDGDQISLDEMYARIWRDAGIDVPAEAQRRIVEKDLESYTFRNERTLEWMRSLKARGFTLGILTNMPRSLAPRFRERFADFIELSSALVISGEVRMFKPQREIYELLASRIKLPASELCFIDDAEANCQGAIDCGWRAVQFVTNEQAEAEFERILEEL